METPPAASVILAGFALMGFLHTIQPDHWLPFTLVAKAQKWTYRKTVFVATLAAIADIAPETVLGLLFVLGWEQALSSAHEWEEWLPLASGSVLVTVGLLYAGWAFWRSRSGRPHFHIHFHGQAHDGHAEASSDKLVQNATIGLLIFSAVSPCIGTLAMFPTLADASWRLKLAAVGTYALVSIAVEVALVVTALRVYHTLRFPWLEKHAETLTGILIALIGIYLIASGHSGHVHDHAGHAHGHPH